MYGLADYNVAVTGQPHSEISSLALFLDHLYEGWNSPGNFPGQRSDCPLPCGETYGGVVKGRILVAGFATRHVAQSAALAGYEVCAVDHFCDQDLSGIHATG